MHYCCQIPGFKIERNGDHIKSGCCDLPSDSLEGVVVNLRNLGGHAGNYWRRCEGGGGREVHWWRTIGLQVSRYSEMVILSSLAVVIYQSVHWTEL